MKKTTLEMQWSEEKKDWTWTSLMSTGLISTALISLLSFSSSEWLAQTTSSVHEGEKVEVVTTQWTNVEEKKDTITLDEAIQSIKDEWTEEVEEEDGPWIEPDPEWDDEWKMDQLKTSTKFTISTWVGYKVWWNVQWVNRIQWSWEIFQGTPFSTRITWIVDLDDPMHSKWSWKFIIWKNIYKWISLDWDYTFTGTGWNLFRFGIGYTWQFWKWVYGLKVFPLNTNKSPIAVKAHLSVKLREDWTLTPFILIDFGNKSYYGEAEFLQIITEWIAAFLQARFWWKLDWNLWEWDSQSILFWFKFDIK